MKIGTFTQQEQGYIGWINTAGLRIADVRFSPMPKQGNGPDFVVLGIGDNGEFEIGAAWAKTSKKGKAYLSVKLDSPALVAPINCALTRPVAIPTRAAATGRSSHGPDEGAAFRAAPRERPT